MQQRVFGQYVLYAQNQVVPMTKSLIDSGSHITLGEAMELEARCDRIVSGFVDPYKMQSAVICRLRIMKQHLNKAQQDCVESYIEENFPQDQEGGTSNSVSNL